jgi:hypothetical protein
VAIVAASLCASAAPLSVPEIKGASAQADVMLGGIAMAAPSNAAMIPLPFPASSFDWLFALFPETPLFP